MEKRGIKSLVTVTTDFGRQLIKESRNIKVYESRLSYGDMVELIKSVKAKLLIDASHPFAQEVSVNGINACKKLQIPYLRYERKSTYINYDNVIEVDSFKEAASYIKDTKGKVLLTIGSMNLDVFTSEIHDYKERLYVRVLPEGRVLAACEAVGFNATNIIAAMGPFSEEMNIAMLRHCNASILVTKDGGDAGGLKEKINACQKIGATVVLIKRPQVNYGSLFADLDEIITKVEQYLKGDGY